MIYMKNHRNTILKECILSYRLGNGILPTGGAFGSDLVFFENKGSFLAFFFFGLSPSPPPVSSSSSSAGATHWISGSFKSP